MKESYDFSNAKRGPVAPTKGKTRITIMLDDAVLDAAREKADKQGIGYQTLINSILRANLIAEESQQQTAGDPIQHLEFEILRDQIEAMEIEVMSAVARLSKKIEGTLIAKRQAGSFKYPHVFRPLAGKALTAKEPGKAVASKKRHPKGRIIIES